MTVSASRAKCHAGEDCDPFQPVGKFELPRWGGCVALNPPSDASHRRATGRLCSLLCRQVCNFDSATTARRARNAWQDEITNRLTRWNVPVGG